MTYLETFGKPQLKRVRQGELLSSVPEFVLNPGTIDFAKVTRDFAIIVSPDCDIERNWDARQSETKPELRAFTFLIGIDAGDRSLIKKDVWNRIKKADHSAYHAIEECPAAYDLEGKLIPPLAFSFRHLFSVPAEAVYQGLSDGTIRRRTQLLSPYRDHLIQRFCSYYGRVALEKNHVFT